MQVRDCRGGKWFWVHNAILDEYGPEIGPIGIAVYCALARHANNSTGECYPGRKELARAIGASVSSVHRALVTLREHGLIAWEQQVTERGDLNSNLYTLLDVTSGGSVTQTPGGSVTQTLPGVTQTPGGSVTQTLPGVTQTHKQDLENKTTEREQDPTTRQSSSSPLTWDALRAEYSPAQVEAAIEAAPPDKRRSLKYVAGILRNWKQEGAPDEAEMRKRRYIPEGYEDVIEH